MAHRWQAAQLVDQGLPYHEVARQTGASTTTVTRVAHWLRHGEGGYRLALDRQRRSAASSRLTIAVPAKGRLREPARRAARGRRARARRSRASARSRFPCRNAPVDVLLVRAADVPEYVQDGVVDCGITGADLVARARRAGRRAAPARLRRLHARGGRARGGAGRRRSTSSTGSRAATVYPAARRAAARRARHRRRAGRGHRLGRGRAAARARRRDRRPRLEREHAAHERPALARRALRVRGGARRPARRRRARARARGDPAQRRRRARDAAT